ncbi:hypothetical protein AMTRI_Chr05g64520 [Amborella trichopoda]|uniref:Pentacotripeptide-repeat region of PRORP domain-containing protein n=1 Tax=Amborella trichopoda TaxID=13333 RepID=W1PDL9_AMBTC|nr:pentatricopeptide repeat-containing protein At1g73400, mitochondrial [Amborella trichopoda]ERN06053.1 hypothetical protein AMTR_s00142p00073110 [Amborella trichopoda]|eukprot:XP_006844378.1 pentatricopeptide repeat-containing protein At1g73400, mitochondrial [Amborella trichopoda]
MQKRGKLCLGLIRVFQSHSTAAIESHGSIKSPHSCSPSFSRPLSILYSNHFRNLGIQTHQNPCNAAPSFISGFCSFSLNGILHESDNVCESIPVNDDHAEISSDCIRVCEAIIESNNTDKGMETALESLGIQMNRELVEQVLHRFQYEEKLAFRFFSWAGKQDGYTHQPQTYNEMMDILSSTKYKTRQYRILCDLLEYMKRKKREKVPIDVLFAILRQYAEKNLNSLKKFAKKKRIRVRTQPEINGFNLLLDALCKCGLVEEAESMFRQLKPKLNPDGKTYNIIFFGWCRVKKPIKAMQVLDEMIGMGFTPENFTYNTAIGTFCRAGMVSEATHLFEFMRTKGSTVSSPTAQTYCIMIVALAKANRMDECLKILSDMRNSGCLPDVSTYLELIEGMCEAGKLEEAYRFMDEMGDKGYPPDIVTYNCIFKVLCNLKNVDEINRLFNRLLEVGILPSVHTYNMLIKLFFDVGEPNRAFLMWDDMDEKGCPRDIDTYCTMIEGLFNSNRLEDACAFLEEIVDKGMKLPYQKFDTFLKRLSGAGDLRTIYRLSDHMRRFYNPAMARRCVRSQKWTSLSLRRK